MTHAIGLAPPIEPSDARIRGDGRDVALRQEAAAEFALLVGENHARARVAGGQRRGESRRAAADDQHVAVGVHPVVAVGIRLGRAPCRGRTPCGCNARSAVQKLFGHMNVL